MATRWTTPDASTPTFKAMQMYRNYDGSNSSFCDTSVSAWHRTLIASPVLQPCAHKTGALTVMVISKVLSGTTPLTLTLAHFVASGTAQAYQLTSSNAIVSLPARSWSGGTLTDTLPAQSITLYVLPKS